MKRATIDLVSPPPRGVRTLVLELRPGAIDLLLHGPDPARYLSVPIGALLAEAIRRADDEWRWKLPRYSPFDAGRDDILPLEGRA
jgi:hypothetical protein